MICRIWNGYTTSVNADIYEQLLKEEIFVGIRNRNINGYRGIQLLRRELDNETEFITIMWFDSIDSVREFAGEDYEQAVVPVAARKVLSRFDERSRHYEVKERDSLTPKVLQIETAIQIQKPADEIYEAIVDPAKMSNYFISNGSGRLEAGKSVLWKFPEFDMEFPVRAGKTEKHRYISFYWEVDGIELLVEITLAPRGNGSTVVTVTEKSRENDEAGIKWLSGNTAGWANFLACLKAYLEYGINLRKGAFDFMASKG